MLKTTLTFSIIFLLFFSTPGFSENDISLDQPIRFNHKLHLSKDIECIFCHEDAEDKKNAGKPDIDICESCHFKVQKGSDEEKKLRIFIAKSWPLNWKRVFKIDINVYFSHARHVTLAQIECETCHKDVGDWETPPPPDKYTIKMDFCINCHKENKVSTNCNSCHR